MLFPGDKIINIGDINCEDKSFDELNLLLNLQQDIITLKVEKSDKFNDGKLINIRCFINFYFF